MRFAITLIVLSGVPFLSLISQAAGPYEALSVIRQEKRIAPDFSLLQIGGETVRLSGFRGNVVVLGFFQTF